MTELFGNTKAICLYTPAPNGIEEERKDELQPFVDTLLEIREKLNKGERVYVGITGGERKGSIAYIQKLDDDYQEWKEPHVYVQSKYGGRQFENEARVANSSFHFIIAWDKRRNKVKWSSYNNTVYLPDYQGPTVWEKFDKKAAAAKMLKENPAVDRDGNELKVGDRVLYINARYGCGASLDRGTVKEIKANVQKSDYYDRELQTMHVIIENDDGSKSDIKESQQSVLKI